MTVKSTSKSATKSVRQPRLTKPKTVQCEKSAVILERTHDSVNALFRAYDLARAQRGKPRGISTDDEQDLLRAMLVLAAAGLDSMVKQLIRDAMPSLAAADSSVSQRLEGFVAKSLGGEPSTPRAVVGSAFLARVLASSSHGEAVIDLYIDHLTGGSLQSSGELQRTAKALALTRTKIDQGVLKPIFEIRNKIIHELDIHLEGDRRKRHHRGLEDMKRISKILLELAEAILQEVDDKLSGK